MVGCMVSSGRLRIFRAQDARVMYGVGHTDAGVAPSWRRMPDSSWTSHASAILPSAMRKMTIPDAGQFGSDSGPGRFRGCCPNIRQGPRGRVDVPGPLSARSCCGARTV
jgi:hypothetical protein